MNRFAPVPHGTVSNGTKVYIKTGGSGTPTDYEPVELERIKELAANCNIEVRTVKEQCDTEEIPMSGSRFYQQPPESLSLNDIGHKLTIAGVVFEGMGNTVVILTPDAKVPMGESNVWFYSFDTQGWANLLAASDDPKFYGPDKAWHRKVRYVVSGEVQQKVWARDDFTCQFCGRRMGDIQLTVDHWIPLELGGANDTTNYISACRACNKRKGDMHPEEYCKREGLDFAQLDAIAKTSPGR